MRRVKRVILWYTTLRALTLENGPLDQYKHALEQLLSKVDIQHVGHSIKNRLSWTFSKTEVANIIKQMERSFTAWLPSTLHSGGFGLNALISSPSIWNLTLVRP